MKKIVIAAALCCALPALAFAQAATPSPMVPDKSTELTYAQIVSAYQGLAALDGYQKIIEEGGKSRAVPQPYDFAEPTREAIADDEIAFKVIIDDEQAKAKAFMRNIGDRPTPSSGVDPTPEMKNQQKKWDLAVGDYSDDLMKKPFKIVITLLTREELKVATLAPSVLAALDPVTKKKTP